MLPGVGSPVIDAGDGAAAADLATDQRGLARVIGSGVDIGSVETGAAAPAITSANGTTFTAGSPGDFTFITTGSPAATLSETNSLPSGVTFTDNGDGTATLSGTPGAGGVYSLNIQANNGSVQTASQAFTLTVIGKPSITSGAAATFAVGQSGSFNVTTGGAAVAALSEMGSLPDGVTFTDNENGTATLQGTPADGSQGDYSIQITATDEAGSTNQSFSLVVTQSPAFTGTTTATLTVGTPGSVDVTTTGFPIAALTENRAFPAGLSFIDNGNGTGTLSGTPAAGSGGVYNLKFVAVNGSSPNATEIVQITIDEAPAFVSASDASFTISTESSFTVATFGYPKTAISLSSGTLPAGLTLTSNGDGMATISGTPTAGGVYNVTLDASNGIGADASQSLTLTVADLPTIVVGQMGGYGVVNVINPDGSVRLSITPFASMPNVTPVVAMADMNDDGIPDVIVAAGVGGKPKVKIFDGQTGQLLDLIDAFTMNYTGGLSLAVADVNGDGTPDIIVGKMSGISRVRVIDGKTLQLIASFLAYDPSFMGGVRVAAADFNNDGDADIVTAPGPGAAFPIEIFDGQSVLGGAPQGW